MSPSPLLRRAWPKITFAQQNNTNGIKRLKSTAHKHFGHLKTHTAKQESLESHFQMGPGGNGGAKETLPGQPCSSSHFKGEPSPHRESPPQLSTLEVRERAGSRSHPGSPWRGRTRTPPASKLQNPKNAFSYILCDVQNLQQA